MKSTAHELVPSESAFEVASQRCQAIPASPLSTQQRDSRLTGASTVAIEEFEVRGENLSICVQTWLSQGNVHRITVQNAEGCALLKIPMALSLVQPSRQPDLSSEMTAISIIAAVVSRPHILIEREIEKAA